MKTQISAHTPKYHLVHVRYGNHPAPRPRRSRRGYRIPELNCTTPVARAHFPNDRMLEGWGLTVEFEHSRGFLL